MIPKVEALVEGFVSRNKLCTSQATELIEIISLIFSRIDPQKSVEFSSSEIRRLVISCLETRQWSISTLATSHVALGNPLATIRINGQIDLSVCNCGIRHRLLLNCMFDNRQAIGTNLLKFEVGHQAFIGNNKDVVSVGICISEEAKIQYGWDSSVATFDEYSGALTMQYSNVLKSLVLLVEVP